MSTAGHPSGTRPPPFFPNDPAYRHRDNCARLCRATPDPTAGFYARAEGERSSLQNEKRGVNKFEAIAHKEARQNSRELTALFCSEKQMTLALLEFARLRGWGVKFASCLAQFPVLLRIEERGLG